MNDYRIPLIDTFMDTTTSINGKEVIAKPLMNSSIVDRVLGAWSVLIGDATAVVFYVDVVDFEEEQRRKFEDK